MELHSENKGRLGDKFEGFQHPPSDAVWDRIAATPTDRPLGARFRMFAVVPHPRVWRRIAAQLQPQQRRSTLIAWSAAAGIALLAGFFLLRPTSETPFAKEFAVHQLPGKRLPNVNDSTAFKNLDVKEQPLNSNSTAINGQWSAVGPQPKRHRITPPRLIDDLENGLAGSAVLADFGHGQPNDLIASVLPENSERWSRMPRRKVDLLTESKEETFRKIAFWQSLKQEMDMQKQAEDALANGKFNGSEIDTPKLFAQAGSSVSAINGSLGPMAMDANDFPELGLNTGPLSLSDQTLGLASSESSSNAEKYQTPLVLGAYLDHPVGKGFAVGGGLVYSKLQSTVEVTGVNFVQNMSLTRQFLGLAAGGTYTLPLGKHFATYASTGVQLDQGLGRHRVLSTRTGGTLVSKVEDRSNNGQQMSANLGLGIRYNLLKRIGLYAQGSAVHYFLQSEENLWTTKAVWPMMQVGVRVNL